MFKKVSEKEKEFVIISRIKALYEKMDLIFGCIPSYKSGIDRLLENFNKCFLYCEKDTIYGKRYIEIEKDSYRLYYGNQTLGDIEEKYGLWTRFGDNYYLLNTNYLFSISKDKDNNEVIIKPYPMVKFTPKEIDLAILEFEEYIEPLYQEAKEKVKKHEKCVEFFSKREE